VRFRSELVDGFRVSAVSGTNTVSFGIEASAEARNGLLGFAVERIDPVEDERYFMPGFKVFPSVIPYPDADTWVSTFEHPIQSLVWDDFTGKPDREYTYLFHPLRGKPRNLDRSATPVPITVRTEPLFSTLTHDVFFNRGVASSQAYARRFDNRSPDDQPTLERAAEARDWLARELDDALLAFIDQAQPGDELRGCFYEFRYLPVVARLRSALDEGVEVRIVVDLKENGRVRSDGTVVPPFPRDDNLRIIQDAGIPETAVKGRTARRSAIAHNKFLVLLRGPDRTPAEVWTGSTNLSDGGIHGQANVGHWIRDPQVASAFADYWDLLAEDPGGRTGDDPSTVRARNREFRERVAALTTLPASVDAIQPGITPIFSPRIGTAPLALYGSLVDAAERNACITFAFGVPGPFRDLLKDNEATSPLCFLLLEKEDRPPRRKPATTPGEPPPAWVALRARNNVYMAFGSEIREPLAQWVRETSTRALGFNKHVAYMHCKFLLHDPLGADPVVVSGSANFSDDSTTENDENMVVIRADRRVADIYFTEFNRLWNHYYFRSVVARTHERQGRRAAESVPEAVTETEARVDPGNLTLVEDDSWLQKYLPGTLRAKRVELYASMAV
jgi:phosphatidylserine/phosphatidylglycerophosphate/cardiolipin synthase-like enzyme